MITSITGRPGEGKTAYAVRFVILPALMYTSRTVCTNIFIDVPKLKEYIEKKGGTFDESQLIVFPHVQPEETKEFDISYLEEQYHTLTCPDDPDLIVTENKANVFPYAVFERKHQTVNYKPSSFWEACPRDSLIVLDEAAEYLNAYDYGANAGGKLLGKFARIHRHQGWDVYLAVQDQNHTGAQLRAMISQNIVIYNYHQHPVLSLVKLKIFLIRHYDYGGTAQASRVAHKMEFRGYDVKIFSLYNTHQHRGGVGALDFKPFDPNKKIIKKSIFVRVREFILGKPVAFIVLALVSFMLWNGYKLINRGKDKLENAMSSTDKAKQKKLNNKNEQTENTSLISDNSTSTSGSDIRTARTSGSGPSTEKIINRGTSTDSRRAPTSSRLVNKYSSGTSAGFELRTTKSSNGGQSN